MRQFMLPDTWEGGEKCTVVGSSARYLARVLRVGPGDSFVGMDGGGRRWLCRVLELAQKGASLRLEVEPLPDEDARGPLRDVRGGRLSQERQTAREPGPTSSTPLPPITLVQGLPRSAKMDFVVRQAAEAGVQRVLPLIARRSPPQGADDSARLGRWRRIVREALQQSGSSVPTCVEAPVDLDGLSAALQAPQSAAGDSGIRLLLHEAPLAQPSLHEYLTETPTEIVLCVGPEGGFAEDEVRRLGTLGFRALHLAGAVLRSETAAIYAVAAVKIVLSERSSWMPRPR